MHIKRSLFILILSFLLCQPQANARRLLTSEQAIVLSIAIELILNHDQPSAMDPQMSPQMPTAPILADIEDPVDLIIDGSNVSILFPNSAVGNLLSCSVAPSLPAGLSVQLVPGGNGNGNGGSCEIF